MVEVASCIPVKFRSARMVHSWHVCTMRNVILKPGGKRSVAPTCSGTPTPCKPRGVWSLFQSSSWLRLRWRHRPHRRLWMEERARKEQDPFLQWPQRPYGLLLPSFQWLIITSFRYLYFFATLLPCRLTDNPVISHSAVCINCVLRHTMTQFCSTFG